jgi:hypothetical protein
MAFNFVTTEDQWPDGWLTSGDDGWLALSKIEVPASVDDMGPSDHRYCQAQACEWSQLRP